MSDSNRLVLTAIIGILVGLILGRMLWYVKSPASLENEQYENASTTANINDLEIPLGSEEEQTTEVPASQPKSETVKPITTTTVISASTIAAGTQPAGKQVKVSVTTDRTVWVVVRDNNAGVMGKILGAKHVEKGGADTIVPLQRATEAKNIYFVVLQDYNGGELDYSLKTVLKDSAGKNIATVFATE